jgi:hypothetical protein
MADDINNKTLATLLVIAIIVSIGGTLISLNRLSKFGGFGVTGFATEGTAKVNLSVTSASGITVTQAIDFGSGYATTSTNCTMESNLTSGSRGANCNGEWANEITDAAKRYIIVQNTGNTQGNLTINASANASSWISAVPADWAQAFYAAINPTADDGCADTNQTIAWTALTTSASPLCANSSKTAFQYGVGHDKLWIAAKVNVPADATPGQKQVDVGIFFTV